MNANSRYAASKTTLITSGRGTNLTVVPSRPGPWGFSFTFYRLRSSDRLDLLATDLYGDGALWWRIADANPEVMDWTNVPVGTVLRLPSA